MAYEEKGRAGAKPHHLILEERAKLTVTGVEEVVSFDEERIVMRTARGDLVATGEGLHIGKLSLETGELAVEGQVADLCYEEPPAAGLWSRLFG